MTRVGVLMATTFACASTALGSLRQPRPLLIWNASPSAPVGLYAVRPSPTLHTGELVAVNAPAPLADWLANRRYLGRGVPLLKHVAATPGQRVCRSGRRILIDSKPAAIALDRDRRGRPLPVWLGCFTVRLREVFLLNAAPDSLDSRYFGPLPATGVIGRAVPLWTRARP